MNHQIFSSAVQKLTVRNRTRTGKIISKISEDYLLYYRELDIVSL